MNEFDKSITRFDARMLEKICEGTLVGMPEGNGGMMALSIDTRTLAVGECYFCIRGERLDGHGFIADALERGAAMIVADREVGADEIPAGFVLGGVASSRQAECPEKEKQSCCPLVDDHSEIRSEECEGCAHAGRCGCETEESENVGGKDEEVKIVPLLIVDDTTVALGAAAAEIRRRAAAKTVAITGSVGKTTTKELTAAILAERGRTHMTDGNYNNLLGLPLTLMKLRGDEWASVLELGMNAGGEISRLSRIASPDAAVITCVGRAHIEFFGSREGIRDAKCEIIDGLADGSLLILDGDEPLLSPDDAAMRDIYARYRVVRVGEGERCDVRILSSEENGEGTAFALDMYGKVLSGLEIPAIGRHILRDAAYAAAAADAFGVSEDEIRRGLKTYRPAGMRQRIYQKDGVTVIEDCYNASPESMKASLCVLSGMNNKAEGIRRVAVLGDMYELGSASDELHREVGEAAADAGIDLLVTVGSAADGIALGARERGMDGGRIVSFSDYDGEKAAESAQAVAEYLGGRIREGDIVLFKASRALKLEKVIDLCVFECGK